MPCNNTCLFFRRLKINHESHEFILDPGTVANTYIRPEKYWLVCVGLLANHKFNSNFTFLSDGVTAAAEGVAGIADVFCH
jgi:hypothetical protein